MHLFLRTSLIAFFLWGLSLLVILYLQVHHPLIQENSSKYTKYRSSKISRLPESIFQYRTGISKDLWIASKENRLHYHLTSPSSTLQLSPHLIETLPHINLQTDSRHFQADDALLNYSLKQFTAQGPITVDIGSGPMECTTDSLIYDIKKGSLHGKGKVTFTLHTEDL